MKKNFYSTGLILLGIVALLTASCGEDTASTAGLSTAATGSAKLENGVKMFALPQTSVNLVSVAIRVPVGTIAEKPAEAGYSLLFARLMANPDRNPVIGDFDNLGSGLVVDLQPDALYLQATMMKEAGAGGIALMGNLLGKTFDDAALLAERDAMVSEMQQIIGSGNGEVRDLVASISYQDLPYGTDMATKLQALTAMTAETFGAFITRCWADSDIAFSLAGEYGRTELKALVTMAQGLVTTEKTGEEADNAEAAQPNETNVSVINRDGSETGLYIVRSLPGIPPSEYYRMRAINFILGGRSTYGRLTALQISENFPAQINSNIDFNKAGAAHVISTTLPTDRAKAAFGMIMNELSVLYSGEILGSRLLDQEVTDARNSLRGTLLRTTETTAQKARFMLWADQYGFESVMPEDHMEMIRSFTKAELLDLITVRFRPSINRLVLVGPARQLQRDFSEYGALEVVE